MRSLLLVGLGLALFPSDSSAQAARHAMPAIIIGNPGEWFGPDQYPKDALRAERQGRVVADISVDLTGTATGCSIEISSGTTSLDTATCDIALAHARFNPAIDRNGKPVTSTYKLPINWMLPDEVPAVEANKATVSSAYEAQIVADGAGMGLTCRTISRSGEAPDPCGNFKPGFRVSRPYVRDGRKVGSTTIVKTSSSVTIDP
ncbi:MULTISPECIES: energy transducer TonB [unclassified Sphingomonas]|uniref:energy transducer TonB n=1 Tax=unclassified Sphingomonas TaxID=196159 RepID=UPI001F59F96F|nr:MULTISPECIES: energy transducer TonB [unclassified Sphingomonas]